MTQRAQGALEGLLMGAVIGAQGGPIGAAIGAGTMLIVGAVLSALTYRAVMMEPESAPA